jgi:hypothetical protein
MSGLVVVLERKANSDGVRVLGRAPDGSETDLTARCAEVRIRPGRRFEATLFLHNEQGGVYLDDCGEVAHEVVRVGEIRVVQNGRTCSIKCKRHWTEE